MAEKNLNLKLLPTRIHNQQKTELANSKKKTMLFEILSLMYCEFLVLKIKRAGISKHFLIFITLF